MENHRKMLLICIWSHIFCNILTWSRKVTTMIDIQVSLTDRFLFSFRSFRTPLILPFSTVPPRKNASAWMHRIYCPHCLLRSLSSPVKQSAAIQITVTYRTWSTCPQQLKAQPLKAGQLKAQPCTESPTTQGATTESRTTQVNEPSGCVSNYTIGQCVIIHTKKRLPGLTKLLHYHLV